MSNRDFEQMIQLGEWLERYLNPNTKPWEYRDLAKTAISFYNIDLQLSDEITFEVMNIFDEQSDEIKEHISDLEKRDVILCSSPPGLGLLKESFSQDQYKNFLDEIDRYRPFTHNESEAFKTIVRISVFIDEIAILFSNRSYGLTKILHTKNAILDFIDFKWFSISAFKKIAACPELWSQTFDSSLKNEIKKKEIKKKERVYYDTPFQLIYSSSLSIFEVIHIQSGVAKKATTFNPSTLYYSDWKEINRTVFPWGPVVSKILIDFLLLGGQEYFLFCKHCGKFTVIKRKGRKKFCSDICRTNYGRAKNPAKI